MFGVLQNQKIEHRNCTYYGSARRASQNSDAVKNGFGMVIFDSSEILLSDWKDDEPHGEFIYIGHEVRAVGTIRDGLLEGFSYIQSTISAASKKNVKVTQTTSLYGFFKGSRLYGRAVRVEEGYVQMLSYIDGKLQQCLKKVAIKRAEVEQFLSEAFPHHHNFGLVNNLLRRAHECSNKRINGKFKFTAQKSEDETVFYGFQESFRLNQFGFVMRDEELLSVGEHQQGVLQGLGRSYENLEQIKDGVFVNGQLVGIGANYNPNSNKYIFGNYSGEKVEIIRQGFNWPKDIISDLRQEFHLRSPFFVSDFLGEEVGTSLIHILKDHYQKQEIIKQMPPQRRNTESFNSYSPLKSPVSPKVAQEDPYKSVRFKKTQGNSSFNNISEARQGRSETLSGYPREYQKRSWKKLQ